MKKAGILEELRDMNKRKEGDNISEDQKRRLIELEN